jgi:spore germination cell wall hydrolase CwlJ-like protein
MFLCKKSNRLVGTASDILTGTLFFLLLWASWMKYSEHAQEKAEYQQQVSDLAVGIYFEARGEKHLEAQRAVAEVILKRVEDPRWPDTIVAVLAQGAEKFNRCQFSYNCDGKPETVNDTAAFETALYVAEVAYADYIRAGEHVQSCAHSYHADYVKRERFPYFMGLAFEKKEGRHLFYCDDVGDAAS